MGRDGRKIIAMRLKLTYPEYMKGQEIETEDRRWICLWGIIYTCYGWVVGDVKDQKQVKSLVSPCGELV